MKNFSFTRSPLSTAITRHRLIPALVLSSLTLFAAPHAGAVMMDLGTLPDGVTSVKANGISGDGSTVVGQAGGVLRPFVWKTSQGRFEIIKSGNSQALAVNGDGSISVGYSSYQGGATTASSWSNLENGYDLGTLGGNSSAATGVNNDGSVIVGWSDTATSRHAFRWDETTKVMQDLGTLAVGETSRANGVSGDGAVIVGWSGTKAFRWDATNKMVDIGNLGAAITFAYATNQDGSVIVGDGSIDTSGFRHSFRWTELGGIKDLGTLGGDQSFALDVNADGSVVVGSSYLADGSERAYRWTEATGMTNLGLLTGTTASSASSVSDDGNTIVGNSGTRAFIWRANSGLQDLTNLQHSLIKSANTLGYLATAQSRRIRDLNQPQCIPGAAQQYCLSVGATGYKGEGDSSGTQKIGQAAAGLRINEQYSVGANTNLAAADLGTQGATQDSAYGLSLWGAYQQNPDNLGWTGTASVAMGQSDNSFERGAGLADVQRAKGTTTMNSTGLRAAVGYGLKVDTTLVTPEIAISHVTTDHDGFTERNVAFPLTVQGGSTTDTYATFGVRTATPLSEKATLHLGAAVDVLLGNSSDDIKGRSQVPGLNNFKMDSSVNKRSLVPVASAGYSYALDANQSLGAHVQVGAGAYEEQKTLLGVGVQYKYAF